ncbi:MAG: hypothetical protein M3Y85_08860 [Bacteroidota bacterium]|nr:hypothetical protein [Bacteroidota bacterium]
MPGRRGSLGSNGVWQGTGGNSLPAHLGVPNRSGNQPSEYKATIDIEFTDGFESGDGDSFEAFITTDNGGSTTANVAGNTDGVRYGFNGKENDNDIEGEGNAYDYGFRLYDPRLGRFLSVDPIAKSYPYLTPYQFASNKPINGIDIDGLEWVLKIYDPQAANNFLKAGSAGDIYKQRGIAYQAINNRLSAEDFLDKSAKNPGIVAEMHGDSKSRTYLGGELIYDKKAPAGVTFSYETQSKGSTTEHTLSWGKGNGAHYDDSYPIDVRAVNSPEHKYFYGSYDFVGKFSNVYGFAGKGGGAGTISGYLKGYGRVEYTTAFYGTGTPSAGVESGMITGNLNAKNKRDYSPSTLAGYGGSQGWGAGIAVRSNWYSFSNDKDWKNFNTANATISGEQNAVSLSISLKRLNGFSANRVYSLTTLVQPVKK